MKTGNNAFGVARALALVGVVMVVVASTGAWIGLQGITLINPFIVAGIALSIGAVSGLTMWKFWRRLTGTDRFALNYLCQMIFCTVFLTGAFYILNTIFASSEPPLKVKAIVENKYTKTRHRTKRVGRNRYVQGQPYKVYCAEIIFEDGKSKNFELPFESYRNLRQERPITISLKRGLFGVDIIKVSDIGRDNPQLRGNKKIYPFSQRDRPKP